MINVELSNIWSCVSLPDLLSGEKDLFDAHLQLQNHQEGGPDFLSWLDAPESMMARSVMAIRSAARTVAACGDTLVVIGAGNAPLAAQAGIRLLARRGAEGAVRVLFAGTSLSSRAYASMLQTLEGHEFSLLLIAGDKVSLECGVASRGVRWLMERRYGLEAKKRVFVAAPQGSTMQTMAAEEGYTFLAQPDCLGCADSGLSPAALLPMAAAGIDPLGVLEGAEEAARAYDVRAFENPVWMYAGARHALEMRGRHTEFLALADPKLMALGRWWESCFLRRSCRGGYGVFPQAVELPGAADWLDGVFSGGVNCFETLLRVPMTKRRSNIELDWKDYDELGFLSERTVGEVEAAFLDSYCQVHASMDAPLLVLEQEQMDEAGFGELLYFFELSAALCAQADGLAPFDKKQISAVRRQTERLLKQE